MQLYDSSTGKKNSFTHFYHNTHLESTVANTTSFNQTSPRHNGLDIDIYSHRQREAALCAGLQWNNRRGQVTRIFFFKKKMEHIDVTRCKDV